MLFILALFFIAMLFPYMFLPIVIFLVLGFLFLIPYVLAFRSFFNILTIPGQIFKIARDRRVRKNHSLEHATINVLEERYGRSLRAGGLAYHNGFSLSGPDLPPPHEVMAAVREGHFRMINGERELAIHPRCGTSMAAANFLFSLGFIIILFYAKHFSLLNVIVGFLLANILANPFGRVLQRFFTTHPEVEDVVIQDIYSEGITGNFPFEFMINPNRSYFINTYQRG